MKKRSTKQSFSSLSLSPSPPPLSLSLSRVFGAAVGGLRVPSNLLLKQKKRMFVLSGISTLREITSCMIFGKLLI